MNLTYVTNEIKKDFINAKNFETILNNSPKKNKVTVTIQWVNEEPTGSHHDCVKFDVSLQQLQGETDTGSFIKAVLIGKKSQDAKRAEALR